MKKLLFLLVSVCFLSNFVQAATINISSCDDAWVKREWRWTYVNYRYYSNGYGPEIYSEYYSDSLSNTHYISYVKFDLSSLPDNSVITSAVLNLYANSNGSRTSPGIYYAGDNWDEETISYDSKPTNGSTIADAGNWSNIANQWVSFNLYKWSYQTDLTDNYLTVMVYALGNGSNGSGFSTKEYLNGNYAPNLSITYIPEPATIAMLSLGALSLLRRKK